MQTMTRSFFSSPPLMAVSKSAMFCSKYGVIFVDHGIKKMTVCSVGSLVGSLSSWQAVSRNVANSMVTWIKNRP